MFVSCHPTVPRNGPDPSKSFFFISQKSPEKHSFFTIFNHFFFANQIFLRFCSQNPIWLNKNHHKKTNFSPILLTKSLLGKNKFQKKGKKSDLPSLTFLGM